MQNMVFAPHPIITLPISGNSQLFPVHHVYCVGRNYADHAVEMGHDPNKEPPFFFQKNPDNLVTNGQFPYPAMSHDVHHEIELMVALKQGGKDIDIAKASQCIFGYGLALDMTRRDLQGEAKKLGRPWEIGKAFDASAPCSALVPVEKTGLLEDGLISLNINGEQRQVGNLNQMIWKIPEVIAYLSRYYTLEAGDIILTGTPAGVGAVKKGDILHGHIAKVGDLDVKVI